MTDADKKRYEVPFDYTSTAGYKKKPEILNYFVETTKGGLKVFRVGEKTPV